MNEQGVPHLLVNNSAIGNKFRNRCNGGRIDVIARALVDYGIVPELALDKKGDPSLISYFAQAEAWGRVSKDLTPSVAELKAALLARGPLAVSVSATPAFHAYSGGVFHEVTDAVTDHAVTLIGWDDKLNAFLVKNSWGTEWGDTCGFGKERGYMWIAYGSNGIGSNAVWVSAKPTWSRRNWATGYDQAIGRALAEGADSSVIERLAKEKAEYMKQVDPGGTGRPTQFLP
jgi:hypothetical protein